MARLGVVGKAICIVSGGQTGVDRAGLAWAVRHGFQHGGWCPKGRRAEDGQIPTRYKLRPTPLVRPAQRTSWNVRDSDATVIFSQSSKLSGGSLRTVEACQEFAKPLLHLAAEIVHRGGERDATSEVSPRASRSHSQRSGSAKISGASCWKLCAIRPRCHFRVYLGRREEYRRPVNLRAWFLALLGGVLLSGCITPPPAPRIVRKDESKPPDTGPFWWGISSSAFQTEDRGERPDSPNYFRTDWDLFADAKRVPPKGDNAEFSWSHFDRDLEALKQIGVNHYRFSIEWARVEPQPGRYNEAAIRRYVDMARKLKAAGIEPVVTLWHFTFPSWLVTEGKAGQIALAASSISRTLAALRGENDEGAGALRARLCAAQ